MIQQRLPTYTRRALPIGSVAALILALACASPGACRDAELEGSFADTAASTAQPGDAEAAAGRQSSGGRGGERGDGGAVSTKRRKGVVRGGQGRRRKSRGRRRGRDRRFDLTFTTGYSSDSNPLASNITPAERDQALLLALRGRYRYPFSRRGTLSLDGEWRRLEYQDLKQAGRESLGFGAETEWRLGRRAAVSLGYSQTHSRSDTSYYDYDEFSPDGQLSYRLTRGLTARASGRLRHRYFQDQPDRTRNYYGGGILLRQKLASGLYLEGGFDRIRQDAVADRYDFDQHAWSLGIERRFTKRWRLSVDVERRGRDYSAPVLSQVDFVEKFVHRDDCRETLTVTIRGDLSRHVTFSGGWWGRRNDSTVPTREYYRSTFFAQLSYRL